MNSTSCGSRLGQDGGQVAGALQHRPEVWRRLTPISAAMMCASVVFPRPGGPNSRTWSSDSLRRLCAAWMKISSCSRIFCWPTKSASRFGRKARSIASSCGEAAAGK